MKYSASVPTPETTNTACHTADSSDRTTNSAPMRAVRSGPELGRAGLISSLHVNTRRTSIVEPLRKVPAIAMRGARTIPHTRPS
jgi:hypothetical protein